VFLLAALGLVPWVVWLAISLPHQVQTRNYRLAWVGFDVGMLVLLASMAGLALRRSPRVELAAASAATYLLVDAWFDVVTAASDHELWQAGVAAVLLEVPLAAVCAWTALHAEQIRRQGIRQLWLHSYHPRRTSRWRRRARRVLGASSPALLGDLASQALREAVEGRAVQGGPTGTASGGTSGTSPRGG
jgi:hypothetical protein